MSLYIDNWDLYFFKQANLIARRSKDPSSIVGTVIVRDRVVLSSGFNGFPIGVKDYSERYNDRTTKYDFISHSEANSCLLAARNGISLKDSTCYTQTLPCCNCAKCLIQSGISKIKTLKNCEKLWADYSKNWIESKKVSEIMLREAGITVDECDIECGDDILIGGKIYII